MSCTDNLTLKEIRELIALFGNAQQAPKSNIANSVIGKYCIARCYSAGVHAGTVESVDGENVVLKDSRRLWSWKADEGVALSGVAQKGIVAKESKVDVVNPLIYLTGVCELIPCTKESEASINGKK